MEARPASACLIDVRCLQDPAYRDRGIGHHARVLLQHGRAMLPGTRLVGLADPAMPELPPDVSRLLDGVRPNAYTGALALPCCHVQLSPMTHDPLFVARLLRHPAIPAAAVVYDFIPLDEPGRYLAGDGAAVDYHVRLRWLARHALFLPISDATAGRLGRLLGVPHHRTAVTGAPLGPAFEALRPRTDAGPGSHVLVVGGPDARKNPECVVRAHAGCRPMQDAKLPLLVAGGYGEGWLAEARRLSAALGGDPALVRAAPLLPAADLVRLFAAALCVVVPSRAEGFSLPVIEGMAAGVPVLASDIDAHRELRPHGLFPPEDDRALARLLEQAMRPAWREAAVAAQAGTWPRFKGEAVATRFWTAVRRLVPGRAPMAGGRKPRVALMTSLPPDRSGVADYSAAMCPELGKRVELQVLTPTGTASLPAGAAGIGALSALPYLSGTTDRVVNVLGNSQYNLDILKLMLRHGGAAIQHDGRMLDLYVAHMGFERTVGMAEAEIGRPLLPNEIWHWIAGDFPPAALILGEIAAVAEPLMLHSRASVDEVRRRHGCTAVHLPFCLYHPIPEAGLAPPARAAARARIGVAADEVVLATFGWLHASKAPADCIWALDMLRAWGVPARLHFVGGHLMDTAPLRRLVTELGLDAHVRLNDGFVDDQSYRDHLVGADIGLQLRTTGPGSVSGALADCVGAGLPSVASAALAQAIDAPDYVRLVPDSPSPVLVAEAAAGLLGGRATAAARRAYTADHGFDRYAAALCAALGLG